MSLLEEAFATIDDDNSGTLDRGEVGKLLEKMGRPATVWARPGRLSTISVPHSKSILYREGRFTAPNGGFWPGQSTEVDKIMLELDSDGGGLVEFGAHARSLFGAAQLALTPFAGLADEFKVWWKENGAMHELAGVSTVALDV